ncbi:MAG: NAD-dependent epimerase/dehydratase family protein [Myxococcota bacterium]|nr:NAD-dependent epimerase/dehydratase family protein [Myxococcota bacterium]
MASLFITGGSGRLGQPLIREALERGDQVLAHARSAASAERLRALGAQVLEGELGALDPKALSGVDQVLHLAGGFRGEGRWTPDRLNRELTEQLLAWLPDLPLTYVSSAAVYGDRSNLWIEEDFDPSPNTRYGHSKVAAERLVAQRGARIVRLAAVYGPGQPFLMAERIREGKAWLPGEGRNHIPTVHALDAARGLLRVSEAGEPGQIYHLADRSQPTLGDFYAAVHRQVGGTPVRFWSTYVPSYVQVAIARQNERLQSRIGQRPRLTPDALKLWTASVRLRTERIKQELGFSWRYADHDAGVTAACRPSA